MMRTTLNIEEDALAYAKERARVSGKPLGAVVSEVLREAARPRSGGIEITEAGMPYLRSRGGAKPVTPDQVRQALEQEDFEKHAVTRR
jgi:hypothetical protein